MKAHNGIRKTKAKRTIVPVIAPPSVVRTPLAEFTAVRPNEAATGMEWKKDPRKFATPNARNS